VTPSRQQALVDQEGEQDQDVAFLQTDAPLTGQASMAYLDTHDIPVIGSKGLSNWFNENPNYCLATSSGDATLDALFAGMVEVGKQKGFTRYGTINCIEATRCSTLYDLDPMFAGKVRRPGRLPGPTLTRPTGLYVGLPGCQAVACANPVHRPGREQCPAGGPVM
jgi:hypothetical protein